MASIFAVSLCIDIDGKLFPMCCVYQNLDKTYNQTTHVSFKDPIGLLFSVQEDVYVAGRPQHQKHSSLRIIGCLVSELNQAPDA